MADVCSANMEVQSPQPSFSASAGKGHSLNFKKHIISVYNEEENLQQQAQSPQVPKPMPDLLPLPDDIPIHPKKRLKKDSDDPVLAEAAASPMSVVNPFSPMPLLSKLIEGDERMPRTATNDARALLGSELLFSAPNSPYASLPSPFDITGLSDIGYPFSPESINQENMPKDLFTLNNNLAESKSLSFQDILSPQCPQQKERLETSHQKQSVRPQSVALDLTSLPRQYLMPDNQLYHENPHHPIRANQQANPLPPPPPPPSCSVAQVLSERPNVGETKRGFQVFSRNKDIPSQRAHLRLIPQSFDRPTGIVPPLVQTQSMYNRGCHSSLVHPYPSKQVSSSRPPDIGGGVEVLRPKAYHAHGRYPHPLLHHPQIGKTQVLHSPPGSQNKRVPSDMINYGHSVFPRDMPQIALQPPTAVNKQVPWLLDDAPNIHPSGRTLDDASYGDSDSFKNKPVQNWTYTDVIYFMFDAIRELNIKEQDLIISKLSGMTGKDLCKLTVEDFRKFLPKTGDIMHRYFFGRLHEERQQAAAAVASSQQESHINRLSLGTPSFNFVNSSNNHFYQPSHHQPTHISSRQPPPSVLMRESCGGGIDASAPYELRYETVDTRAISGYDENTRRLLSETLPSASGKSFDLLHAPSPAMPFDVDDNVSDPDQSSNEEEVKPEPPKKRGPGRPRKPENELKKKKKKTGRLWEFIRNLLLDPETCPSLVKWENPEEGIFRFVQAEKVAQKWGERKQNKDMNYEKLSRAMRYYYKGGVFEAVIGRRLVYKFGKNAKNWKPSNPNFVNHLPYSQSSSH